MNRSTKKVLPFVLSVTVVVLGVIIQALPSFISLSSHTIISGSSSSSGSMSTSMPSSMVVPVDGVSGTKQQQQSQQQQSVTTEENECTTNNKKVLVVGTRIHLGQSDKNSQQQKLNLNQDEYNEKICKYYNFCYNICFATNAVIAIDGACGTELYTVIQNAITYAKETITLVEADTNSTTKSTTKPTIDIIIVQPWGRFVPALNSIISWSMQLSSLSSSLLSSSSVRSSCDYLLLVSIEAATASKDAIQQLVSNMQSTDSTANDSNNNDGLLNPILVTGAVLPGHDYQHNNPPDTIVNNDDRISTTKSTIVPLNGLTSPWNTLAIWNVRKLALTGFQLVSEGLIQNYCNHDNDSIDNNYYDYAGIEEVVTIGTLQKILGSSNCIVKLVKLYDNSLEWDTTITSFGNDKKRQEWHIRKMQSKLSRSIHQLQLVFGTNYLNENNNNNNNKNNFIVHHC